MRNPLTTTEYKCRIASAEAEIEQAKHFLQTDPHVAEEHAYIAQGILKHLDEVIPASISYEKKQIITELRRTAQIIIDRADYLQGRKAMRNPLHPSTDMPHKLKTIGGEKVHRTLWRNIRQGDIVYLYSFHEGKEFAIGPFQVVDAENRVLRRIDSMRTFIHYPEELYRLDIKQNPYKKNPQTSGSKQPIPIGHIRDVAKLLELPDYDDMQEDWWEAISTMSYEAMSQAEEEDIEEAGGEEEYREEIEEELTSELYRYYKNAVEAVLETLLENINAEYEQIGDRYQIVPDRRAGSWKDVARGIMEIINGIGLAYAGNTVEEFLEISQYTNYKDLVKGHLGYLKRYPSVYGGPTPEGMFHHQMKDVQL